MDRAVKALIYNGEISLTLLDTTEMVNRAIEIHKLSPLAAAALGRTMTVATFMSIGLKNKDDTLSVTISGDGPAGTIVVCGNHDLKMRGYIDNPQVELPLKKNGKLDVGGAVGKGRISVVVIQPMPGASDESIDKAEKLLSEFTKISSMIEEYGIDGIIDRYFDGVFFFEYEPEYKCTCSKDYVDKILITLGKEELYDTIEKEGKVEVVCQFCPNKYTYLKEDVDKLFDYEK